MQFLEYIFFHLSLSYFGQKSVSVLVSAKSWNSLFPGSLQKSKTTLNFEGHYVSENPSYERSWDWTQLACHRDNSFLQDCHTSAFWINNSSQICSFFCFYFHWKSQDFHTALQTIWCWKVFPRGNTILQEDCHMVSLKDILYMSAEHSGWQN